MKNLVRTSLVAASLLSGGAAMAHQDEPPQKISRHFEKISHGAGFNSEYADSESRYRAEKKFTRTNYQKQGKGRFDGKGDSWG